MEINLEVIKSADRRIYTDTFMCVCSGATKTDELLGSRVTKTCDGAVFKLIGVDEEDQMRRLGLITVPESLVLPWVAVH
ncbi:hypothetical protein [Enterococcus sp. AZ109]|uniref:hypothetical protein n=1 Tax=Enterococcus sp. AZ109 TaxID=2774634 RepID=UPI003F687220